MSLEIQNNIVGLSAGNTLNRNTNTLKTNQVPASGLGTSEKTSDLIAGSGLPKTITDTLSIKSRILDAKHNSLVITLASLDITSNTIPDSDSIIDIPDDCVSFTRDSILAQAAQAMLSHAQLNSQDVIKLIND